jgi:hypothetical protein
MRTRAIIAALAAVAIAGCGGGSDKSAGTTSAATATTATALQTTGGVVNGKLPPGSVGPPDVKEEEAEGPAATEASPEASPVGPSSSGELSGGDRSGAIATASAYITALDRHDAGRVCTLLLPGSLDLSRLPQLRGGCRSSLAASIGTSPRNGGPAWRKTTLVAVKPEDLGDGRARLSATVTHHFSDRKYVSVEDDVIYLQKVGGRWLLAKPSGTLYRAVGYPQPPLSALTPPSGWN